MRATHRRLFSRSVVVSGLAVAVAACGVAGSGSASAKDPQISTESAVSLSSTESSVIAKTNEARAKRGLAPLAADAALMNGARRQASWMARNRNLSHGQGVTENIAMGQSSASEAVADWMRSDGHRANILGGSHSRIGVAMARTADGTVYWCQQFR